MYLPLFQGQRPCKKMQAWDFRGFLICCSALNSEPVYQISAGSQLFLRQNLSFLNYKWLRCTEYSTGTQLIPIDPRELFFLRMVSVMKNNFELCNHDCIQIMEAIDKW